MAHNGPKDGSQKNQNEETPMFYWENGLMVFTEAYHLKRGYCCGSGCRHCPWKPRDQKTDRPR